MPRLSRSVVVSTRTVFAVAVVLAVASDGWGEIRARAGAPALVSVCALHRMYLVEPALRALSSAGIVAHARARRYRMLFHFFAPWTPVEVLVPPERAAEAEALCAHVAGVTPAVLPP